MLKYSYRDFILKIYKLKVHLPMSVFISRKPVFYFVEMGKKNPDTHVYLNQSVEKKPELIRNPSYQ